MKMIWILNCDFYIIGAMLDTGERTFPQCDLLRESQGSGPAFIEVPHLVRYDGEPVRDEEINKAIPYKRETLRIISEQFGYRTPMDRLFHTRVQFLWTEKKQLPDGFWNYPGFVKFDPADITDSFGQPIHAHNARQTENEATTMRTDDENDV